MLFCCALASVATAQKNRSQDNENNDWQLIGEDKLVSVSAEKVLYKDAKQVGFYVHVRIHKKASGPLGLSRQSLIQPNQWGFYPDRQRGVIDEITANLPAIDTTTLIGEYRNGSMQAIPEDLDYYGYFNAAAPGLPDFDQARYLLVSMYGRLLLSDGKVVDTLFVNIPTDLAISLPVQWRPLPSEANSWFSERK